MVMKPEPFGEAFDALGIRPGDTIVFTTPSGERFDQALARELSGRERLVFCCGRYEGIDQRVIEYAGEIAEVREISLGDYVLNGGEVAALAITEAVVRLLPGFMGNAESLVEESHADGLLEYPVYTKPALWRDREVPEVLLSGNHGRIGAWRAAQAVRRTALRRPDLLHPSNDGAWTIEPAVQADAGELWTLQRACLVTDAQDNDNASIPPLTESFDQARAALDQWQTWVVRSHGRLIGSVRGRTVTTGDSTAWEIGRLMVAPDIQGRGLGSRLLQHVLDRADPAASSYLLVTGANSRRTIKWYAKAGFRAGRPTVTEDGARIVTMTRPR